MALTWVQLVYEALKAYNDSGASARYVSNIDPNDMAELKGINPETTLFIVVLQDLKSPWETLTNARLQRILETLKAQAQSTVRDVKRMLKL